MQLQHSWKHNFNKYFDIVSGSQGMFQSNTNGQYVKEILVPNSNFNDLGAYTLLKGTFNLFMYNCTQILIYQFSCNKIGVCGYITNKQRCKIG